jgi:hypothetical protein
MPGMTPDEIVLIVALQVAIAFLTVVIATSFGCKESACNPRS